MSPFGESVPISAIDVVFLAVLAVAALRAAVRGFVAEAFTVGAVIVGLGGAAVLTDDVVFWLNQNVADSAWNQIIAFLLLFVVLYLAVKTTEALLHRFFAALHLQKLDHVLGLVLGVVEGLLVIVVVVVVLALQPVFDSTELLGSSTIAQVVLSVIIMGAPFPVPSAT